MKTIFAISLSFFSLVCFSQAINNVQIDSKEILKASGIDTSDSNLNSTIIADSGNFILRTDDHFELLFQAYISQKKVQGFKIQLFAGNKRMDALKMKADYMKKYEEQIPPKIIYQQPNYKVRVGNYRDRLEATRNLELYKIDFPSAFIVKDAIDYK